MSNEELPPSAERLARGRQVVPTPEGRVLHEACERVFATLEEAQEELQRERKRAEGRIRLGATVEFGTSVLMRHIRPFLEAHPRIEMDFHLIAVSTASVARVKLVRSDGGVVGERDYALARLAAASKVFLPNDGAFGLDLDDGGYGFGGRLDILAGAVDFLSATLVLEGCPEPAPVQTYLLQAFGSGSNGNTTFTRDTDGTLTFTGSSSSASWSGSILPGVDGTVSGSVT